MGLFRHIGLVFGIAGFLLLLGAGFGNRPVGLPARRLRSSAACPIVETLLLARTGGGADAGRSVVLPTAKRT